MAKGSSRRPVKVGSMGKKAHKEPKITTARGVVSSTGRLNRVTNAKQERSKITRV